MYVSLKSSPVEKDSDNDGIDDKEDTAPLKKGLADGIVGELTIVSCHPNDAGFTGGHAWLSYKSYVQDDLDVSGLLTGYTYNYETKEFQVEKLNSYNINVNGNVCFGNAGTDGTSGALSTVVGSCGGVLYNREFYGAWVDNNFYVDVAAYTRKVTDSQLQSVIQCCADNSYYNLYSNNCSSVANKAWNSAFGSEDGFESKKKGISNGIYSLFDTPATLKENILKKDDADEDYISTMLDIIKNWR